MTLESDTATMTSEEQLARMEEIRSSGVPITPAVLEMDFDKFPPIRFAEANPLICDGMLFEEKFSASCEAHNIKPTPAPTQAANAVFGADALDAGPDVTNTPRII